jgi:hypothetical protein
MKYRPWGLLDWTLSISAPRRWFFIGALGTEDRSLAAWTWVKELGVESGRTVVQVNPIDATRFCARTRTRLDERRKQFVASGGNELEIKSLGLLAEAFQIEDLALDLSRKSPAVVLDISSLPKRFFFPLLRSFARCEEIRDLVVTYTCPRAYQTEDKLSEGAGKWDYLPGFLGAEKKSEVLIAAVGFMVDSLQGHLSGEEAHPAVQLLIPFPATPSAVRRSWESVFNLQSTRSADKFVKHRVDANDMSAAFDRICSIGRNRNVDALAFAPFGPKPISAAMCLYAAQRDSAVHYPQPDGYHPDYSIGVATVNGKPFVNAYWIKHEGKNLYTV